MARDSRCAFTLVEILVVIVILAILVTLILPVVQGFVSRGNSAKCISNLRQISAASASYSADNNGAWPRNSSGNSVFLTDLMPYFGQLPNTDTGNFKQSPLFCPATSAQAKKPDSTYSFRGFYILPYKDSETSKPNSYALSYGQNTYAQAGTVVRNRLSVNNSSKMMLYMDYHEQYLVSLGGVKDVNRREVLIKRHAGMVNVAYADGSVGSISYDDIPTAGNPAANTPNASSMFWTGRGMSQ